MIASALLIIIGFNGFGQDITKRPIAETVDSIKFLHYRMAALKYPAIRQASISTDFVSGADLHSKLLGNELFDGKAQFIRTKAYFTVPVASWGKNTISSTFGLVNEHIKLSNVRNHTNSPLDIQNMKTNFTTLSFSGSFTRSDSLFNKPVTYMVSVTGVTNASLSRIRMTSIGFASINLIRNPVTSLSVGAVLIGDPSSIIPAYVLVSYSRRFSDFNLELLADLPSRVVLRKELSPKSFISLGNELSGSMFFINNLNQPGLPNNAISTSTIIKSGLTYERLISKNIVLGVSAGVLSSPSNKTLGAKSRTSDYFIKTKSTNEPYVNFSLSFLPFWRGLRL